MSERGLPSRKHGVEADERGVSEVVGYVLVFGLVITSVALVTFGGVNTLEDTRDRERATNAERAFDVVADNMASIYDRNSPSRATEIDLSGGQLFYDDPITITVTVDDGTETEYEREVRPIVLRTNDDHSLVYEAGAVFRDQRNGGFTTRDAPFVLKDDHVHIPIVKTTAPAVEAASGTTVLLRGQSTERDVLYSERDGSVDEIRISISSPRYELWATQLESHAGIESCDIDGGTESVECSVTDPEKAYVTVQEIEVSIVL